MMTRILLFALGLFAMVSCADNIDEFVPDPSGPIENPITFRASAFVEVRDINGDPIEDAMLKIGDSQKFTNEDGVVYFKDVTMSSSTYVVADKPGYFHGSRMFYPEENGTHYATIVLLPEQIAGSIQASQGGTVNIDGGMRLEFPANSIADANGNPYNGNVDVAAFAIPADDPELSDRMPGDLVGVRENGDVEAMASYGMVAVELQSPTGEVLQVSEGSEVQLSMDVPSSLTANAPSTIPLWYFDEDQGVWVEEGSATLQGNTYVGTVEHFSFWNCDIGAPLVNFEVSFVYEDGTPASDVLVCLTLLNTNTRACSYTNADGVASGKVFQNEELLLEVVDQCGNAVYSQQVGPFTQDAAIGPFTITELQGASMTTVTGSIVNCDGEAVTNGFVKIKAGNWSWFADLDDNGMFDFTFINCDESDVTISAVDEDALKQSLPQTYTFSDEIEAGEITACDDIQELITITVEGFDPVVFFLPDIVVEQGEATIIASIDSLNQNSFFFLRISGDEEGVYDDPSFEIGFELPGGDPGMVTDLTVTVTYFGDQGDFVQGTLDGIFTTSPAGQPGEDFPLTGTFSVLRD